MKNYNEIYQLPDTLTTQEKRQRIISWTYSVINRRFHANIAFADMLNTIDDYILDSKTSEGVSYEVILMAGRDSLWQDYTNERDFLVQMLDALPPSIDIPNIFDRVE